MCTLLHIFVNFFDNEPYEHIQVKTDGMIAMKYISNSIIEPSPQILSLPDTINVNFNLFPDTAFAPVYGN